jgi:hypothetical protein
MQSINNWTSTALVNGATYTGTFENVAHYPSLIVSLKTDVTGLLYVDYSVDGVNVDSTLTYTIAASINEVHRLTNSRAYVRVRMYNNSGSNQSYLRLQCLFGNHTALTSPLNLSAQQDADASITRIVDFKFMVAQGKFSGFSTVNKFGKNADIDVGTEDIWGTGGTWVAPTVARVHNIVSSNVNDASAGTGARTLTISGLDASYLEISEMLTMNGTTVVPTVNSYTIIHRAIVNTAGSTGSNVGTITATAVTDGTISLTISATKNQSQFGIYQVPANKTAYLYQFHGGISGGTSLELDLYIKPFGGVFNLKNTLLLTAAGQSTDVISYDTPLVITEKSIIKLTGTATANNTIVVGSFDLILVDN